LALAQGHFRFTEFGENQFDNMTETRHTALLSARPQQRTWTRSRELGHYATDSNDHKGKV
jgi:hypothetical protein